MSPTAKTNLGLSLLLATLLALALFGRPRAPEPILPALQAQQVNSLRLEMSGRSWQFRRLAGGWQGDVESIDADTLNKLAKLADAVSLRRFPAGRADPRELGLEPARARLSLNGRQLSFGATEPIDGHRYLLAGDQVHLIEDRYWPLLLKIRQSAGVGARP